MPVPRFLRNCWQVAAFGREIGAALLSRSIAGEPVLFYRTPEGAAVALEDRCAHRSLPLSMGTLRDGIVECGYHGLCYDASGECVAVPGQNAIPPRARVRKYPLVERNTLVWIWMGDPSLADPAFVPNIFWFDDPAWACSAGYHHIDADYRLLNDNLLDLSHETFVHKETIGNRAVAESKVTAKIVDDREVRVYRMMEDVVPPPFYASAFGFDGNIDRWHTSIYQPPGIIVIENGAKPVGSDDPARTVERRVINLITPETATSSHYFWAVARQYRLEDAELTDYITRQIIVTFDQDKRVLEAQQQRMGPDPDRSEAFPVTIHLDAGPILGRRLLAAAIEQDVHGVPFANRIPAHA